MADSDLHIGLEVAGSEKVACKCFELHNCCSAADSVDFVDFVDLPMISSGDFSSLVVCLTCPSIVIKGI